MQLTQGAIQDIHLEKQCDKPRLQVLSIKKIANNGQDKPDRYRLNLSDGVHKQPSAMLATQLNHLITDDKVTKYGVLQLERYICNTVSDRRILIVLDASVVERDAGAEIGSPQPLGSSSAASASKAPVNPAPVKAEPGTVKSESAAMPQSVMPKKAQPYKAVARTTSNNAPAGLADDSDAMPIEALNPYQRNWVIVARVTNMSERTYRNNNGEGKILNLELLDKSGEIRATAFNEQADMIKSINPPIQVGNMIRVQGGKIKPANKQYSRLKHNYEITFGRETMITLAADSGDAPTVQYDFVDFSALEGMQKQGTYVDVLAVVKGGDDNVSTITSKRTGQDIIKREISLIERSMIEIRCTLWGKSAEDFKWEEGDVICIKGAGLSDFNGVSMSIGSSSSFELNADREEVHQLRGWYESEGKLGTFTRITGGGSGSGRSYRRVMAHQIKDEQLGMRDNQPDFFSMQGTVTFVRKSDGMIYKACQTCKKKVLEEGENAYRCEKCKQTYSSFDYRAMASVSVLDSTGQVWISNFADTAEVILGMSSQELGQLREADEAAFEKQLASAHFKKFNFTCRAKAETYMDETRAKVSAVGVSAVDPVAESRYLIGEINKYVKLAGAA